MCGGNKGQSQQTTSQSQTYAPNAQAAGYITNALDRASQTANLPFNVPVAPVAGFSQDQQNAFGTVNNLQGSAQPYFNQAANYYQQSATPDVSQFFNPYASAVTDNLKDIFGSQMSQTTGQLTQAAGGVGADRIAVGQSELAKQQGLAAGQTLASLYQPSLAAAQNQQGILQNAGNAYSNLGMTQQNAALQGANAQLTTGGLQQQLQQAQMNAPYQQQVAQAAFPYQQSQYLASIVGALAPGLGGTTTGGSNTTTTPAQPSIWSQLIGGAGALAGGLGATGAFGSNGWLTGASQPGTGATYGGYSTNGGVYGTGSYGGVSYPAFAGGGGVDDDPIDISGNPFIPQSQLVPIKPNIPQLQAPPQQQSGSGSSGGGIGDLIGSVAKVLPFFLARGGSVNPYEAGQGYALGGSPTDEEREAGYELLRRGLGTRAPDTIPGGEAPPIAPTAPAEEPFRMPSEEAVQAWRDGADRDRALGLTKPVPETVGAGPSQRPVSMDIPTDTPMSYAPQGRSDTSGLPPEVLSGRSKADANPYAASGVPNAPQSEKTLADNPWMSLLAAGLGIMGGTSPFAGVNIGKGGAEGLKALQQQKENSQKDTTIAQAARRLEQDAKFHEDQYSRMTMGQKEAARLADRPYKELTAAQKEASRRADEEAERAEKRANRPYEELTAAEKAAAARAGLAPGFRYKDDGKTQEPVPGGPHDPATIRAEQDAKRGPGMSDETLAPLVDSYMKGNTGVLAGVGRGVQGAQNLEKFWGMMSQKLQAEGKTGADLAASRANFMAQSAGMRVAAQREANIETAVNEARGTFPLVLEASKNLPRTNFPLANKAIEAYRTNTGSPEQRKYGASLQAAVTAYSQAMSRTGANSVHAQQHAEALLNKADGDEAMRATIEQLDAEMQIAQAAPEKTRQSIINRILGVEEKHTPAVGAGAASASTPAAAPAVSRPQNVPAGSQYSPSRKMWRTPDGKMFDAQGNPV